MQPKVEIPGEPQPAHVGGQSPRIEESPRCAAPRCLRRSCSMTKEIDRVGQIVAHEHRHDDDVRPNRIDDVRQQRSLLLRSISRNARVEGSKPESTGRGQPFESADEGLINVDTRSKGERVPHREQAAGSHRLEALPGSIAKSTRIRLDARPVELGMPVATAKVLGHRQEEDGRPAGTSRPENRDQDQACRAVPLTKSADQAPLPATSSGSQQEPAPRESRFGHRDAGRPSTPGAPRQA